MQRSTVVWGVLTMLAAVAASAEVPAGKTDQRLLAAWSFDELDGPTCRDSSGHGFDVAWDRHAAGIERVPGVWGEALRFQGQHLLRTSLRLPDDGLTQISFSAWVAPTELGGYREIFRKEDGDRRLLFSFQVSGAALSLGLNVGGYIECRANIEPAEVLDGQWHHTAATFDGQALRVYLDGRQIGELPRPGTIRAGGPAPGCIGSSNGGENFQGRLDELRIYTTALSAAEIRGLYRSGIEVIGGRRREAEALVGRVYAPQATFTATAALCRQKLAAAGLRAHSEVARVAADRLQADFPAQSAALVELLSISLAKYLQSDAALQSGQAQRVLEMAQEYKPLTPEQWRRQPPDAAGKWQAAEALAVRLDVLKARGPAGEFSPEWLELMLAAGQHIQLRPYQHEPVAPYVHPETPPTRDLSPDEARETLERDWLHQAQQRPTPARIRDEIQWTRQLAQRIAVDHPDRVDFAAELKQLDEFQRRLPAADRGGPADAELYFAVRQVKRSVTFKNPLIDFDRVVFVDMPYPQGREANHETRHRLGYMAVPGGRLLVLTGLSPSGKLRQLMPQAPLAGSFWRPDVSYNADKVLVSFKPHNEKSFHLYEINVAPAGRNAAGHGDTPQQAVQLTDGPYDDLDPIYLPDDRHLLFSTTRGNTYVRCMPPTNAFVLARCGRDGRDIYLISTNNEPDYLPSVLDDGRVVYTRWEYTDKPLWRAQKLWTVNPDGTQVSTLWGNQSVWPDVMKDARQVPGTRRVMFTGSAHHNWFAGSVGIIDPDQGLNFPAGLTKVTADVVWPECGNGPTDPIESPRYHRSGDYTAYYSPYPLGEHDFLVSASRGGKFLLYLMDVDGNRELIYEGENNIFHAVPLRARRRPPLIADRVAWPSRSDRLSPQPGVIYSSNVYQGAPPELRDRARFLRVLEIDPKTYTYWYKRPYISTGPVVSMVQSEGVKRVLGTVPIEPDGSVSFHAPPGRSLHFQLLDENQRALQTMRSFVGVMPGEYRGCLGCHEAHSRAPVSAASCLALDRPPRPITPPPWSDDTVSYPRYVKPVLEKYCGQCHQQTPEGRAAFDLTDRPGFLDFSEPYITLIGRPSWGKPYQRPDNAPPGFGIAGMIMVEAYRTVDPAAYKTPAPMQALSYRSHLIDLCSSGRHYKVQVDPINLQRLITWVDAMCPYCGEEEIRALDDPQFQGVDWLAVRPRIKTAPRIVRPGPVD